MATAQGRNRSVGMTNSIDPEYRLIVSPLFDDATRKSGTLLRLETFKVFASFQYELSVKETEDPPRLHLKVLGLKTPPLSLPATGHAQFSREYARLQGEIEVTVEGLEGKTATVRLNVLPNLVQVLRQPKGTFLEVKTTTQSGTEAEG